MTNKARKQAQDLDHAEKVILYTTYLLDELVDAGLVENPTYQVNPEHKDVALEIKRMSEDGEWTYTPKDMRDALRSLGVI